MNFLQRAVVRAVKRFVIGVPPGFHTQWKKGNEPRLDGAIANPSAVHPYSYGITQAAVDTLTQSPFTITPEGSDVSVTAGPVFKLFDMPNMIDSGVDLWDLTVRGLLQNSHGVLWQYGFTSDDIGPQSLPVSIDVINANRFMPIVEKGIFLGWRRRRDSRMFSPQQMVWFRFPDPESIISDLDTTSGHDFQNRFMSLTPFRALARGITDDVRAGQFNSDFFNNGARLGLVLKTEEIIEEEEEARMLLALDRDSVPGRRFKNLILSGAKWTTDDHSLSHKDMEFIKQREFHRQEQRAATRTGPLFLGDVTDGNRANVIGQERVYWRNVILPLQRRLERTVKQGYFQRFTQASRLVGFFDNTNVEALQSDIALQTETATKLHKLGFTPNELNEMFEWGFEPDKTRDTVFLQSTLVPAEDLLDGGLAAAERADAANPRPTPVPPPKEAAPVTMKTAAEWRRVRAKVAPLERRMRPKVARNLLALRAGVLSRLAKFDDKAATKAPPSVKDLDRILFDAQRTGKAFAKELEEPLRDAVRTGGDAIIDEANLEGSFDHLSPSVTSYMDSRTPPLVGVHQTVRESLQLHLTQAISQGQSVAEMAQTVRSVFNTTTAKAQQVALTEINGAFNNGRDISMEAQGIKKIEWLTAADEDVRDTHARNNGLIRTRGKQFPNGLTHPHQRGAPAKEVINCRCAAAPVVSKGADVVPFRKERAS